MFRGRFFLFQRVFSNENLLFKFLLSEEKHTKNYRIFIPFFSIQTNRKMFKLSNFNVLNLLKTSFWAAWISQYYCFPCHLKTFSLWEFRGEQTHFGIIDKKVQISENINRFSSLCTRHKWLKTNFLGGIGVWCLLWVSLIFLHPQPVLSIHS